MNTPIASDPLKAPVFGMPTEVPQGSVRPLEDPVRGFVHDVRTPLGAVRGFAEVILDDPDLDVATRTEFMQTIIREADRAIELVRQLGDLARVRRDPLPMGPVGILPGVVEPVLHEMQELASGEGVDLVTEVFACPVTLKCAPDWIGTLIRELIGMSIRWTPAEGRVRVGVSIRGGVLRIESADGGDSVTEAQRQRLLDPYFRERMAPRQGGSAGLGLVLASEIARVHGGHVLAQHGDGGGVVLSVELPLEDGLG
jgi:signal transduction histidine kinase